MHIIWQFLAHPDLSELERQPVSAGLENGPGKNDRRIEDRRVLTRETPGQPVPNGPFYRVAQAILAYDIFPSWLVHGVLRRTPLEAGDTFGMLFPIAPGVGAFFGGRVTRRFDGEHDGLWRAGFSLRTVVGHPMVGEETFYVEKDLASGTITAAIESWSRPSDWLPRLAVGPLRWMQTRACNAAFEHLRRIAQRTSH